jgi:hypothetical protein
VDGQLVAADLLPGTATGDEPPGRGTGAGREHPAGDVPAIDVQDHGQVVVRPSGRAAELGDVPARHLVRAIGLDGWPGRHTPPRTTAGAASPAMTRQSLAVTSGGLPRAGHHPVSALAQRPAPACATASRGPGRQRLRARQPGRPAEAGPLSHARYPWRNLTGDSSPFRPRQCLRPSVRRPAAIHMRSPIAFLNLVSALPDDLRPSSWTPLSATLDSRSPTVQTVAFPMIMVSSGSTSRSSLGGRGGCHRHRRERL